MIDLTSACQRTADVLANVSDDQLTAPTPCENLRLDELVAHVGVLAHAFTASARKDFGPMTDTPPTDGAELEADWRTAYPATAGGVGAGVAGPGRLGGNVPCRWRRLSGGGGWFHRAGRGGAPRLGCRACHGRLL